MASCTSCGGTLVSVLGNIFRCEYCSKLYSNTNGEFSEAEPERLYSYAVNMAKSNNESSMKSAIETLEALGSYKDSSALANTYRGMIAQSRVEAEERRLEAERQAELERIQNEKRAFEAKQKAKIRGIVIAAVSAVAVVAVIVIIINNSHKTASYNRALELYNVGQYEDAVEVFSNLGNYSDSASYVSMINNYLKDRDSKYEKGVGYYKKAAYGECIAVLTEISGYLDAADYIEKSAVTLYQQATEKYNAGELEKAKELLGKIPKGSSKYMDAELLLANIEEIISEQAKAVNYEQAKIYLDNGDYETAQRLFINLGNYEDSANYLSLIGSYYYDLANSYYQQGAYAECGDIVKLIDTAEEWGGCETAIELRDKASSIYCENVADEAKEICRREGYGAMAQYIDSKVCSILSPDTAAILKTACEIKSVWVHELSYMDKGTMGDEFWDVATDAWGSAWLEDNMGETHSYKIVALCTVGNKYTMYRTYALDGKYSTLSGTLSICKDCSVTPWIEFWGDGKKIGETVKFDNSTRPYNFEIDVSGVNDLKIQVFSNTSAGSNPYLLTDGFLLME